MAGLKVQGKVEGGLHLARKGNSRALGMRTTTAVVLYSLHTITLHND